jgi:hypothetical protein
MTYDSTTPDEIDVIEAARLKMIVDMPLELAALAMNGEKVWDTHAMRSEFDVIGFSAPLVVVKRKSDGVVGSLKFTHSPRFYFGFMADPR